MLLKGLQKTTLLDFPTKVACTVFTGGCNFRCPFCHNASLVLGEDKTPDLPQEEFFRFLERRRGILDGVCVTGGEPLLQKDLIPFLQKIRDMGLAVKLDTNGSAPGRLAEILRVVPPDYIAMDIKNSREKYAMTCGLPSFPEGVEQSIDRIMNSGIPYEFRTTVVRELHTVADIKSIARRIAGARHYYLQGFIDSGDLIGENYSACTPAEMKEMLAAALPYVPTAALRGVDTGD